MATAAGVMTDPTQPVFVAEEVVVVKEGFWSKLGRMMRRMWEGTKNLFRGAARTTQTAARRVWRETRAFGRGAWNAATWGVDKTLSAGAWTLDRLYWSGRWAGRQGGRVVRFLGRGARNTVVATPRFLGRTLGWTLRLISLVVREVEAFIFNGTFLIWLGLGVVVAMLAFGHDWYDKNVHKRTVAMSRGKMTTEGVKTTGQRTQRSVGYAVNEMQDRVGDWENPNPETIEPEIREAVESLSLSSDIQPGDLIEATRTTHTGQTVPGVEVQIGDETFFVPDDISDLEDDEWVWRTERLPVGADIGFGPDVDVVTLEQFFRFMMRRYQKAALPQDDLWMGTKLSLEDMRRGYSYWLGRYDMLACFVRFGLATDSEAGHKYYSLRRKILRDAGQFDHEGGNWRLVESSFREGFMHELARTQESLNWYQQQVAAGSLPEGFSFGTQPEVEARREAAAKAAEAASVKAGTASRSARGNGGNGGTTAKRTPRKRS